MPSFVTVGELTKSFNGLKAVDSISFTIPPGAVFGLLGPNGAGKTTVVSMLSGLLQPDSGDIYIGDYNLRQNPLQAKKLMGVVPQEIALYPTLTARENLRFWGRLYRLDGKALACRIEEVLNLVGLQDRGNEPVERYSGGMKRRINIAAGLLHNPRLLLLDEPTVGVDPQSRRSILDTIKELNRKGLTVLYTSHYMEEVEELCTQITIMDRGRIIAAGRQKELIKMVEGSGVIKMELNRPLETSEALKKLPGIKGVSGEDNLLRLTVEDSHKVLAPAIEKVTGFGGQIASVTVEEPSLETVFLHLTGRGLRD